MHYGYYGQNGVLHLWVCRIITDETPAKNIYVWLKDLGESLCAANSPRQTTGAALYTTNYFLSPTISLHKKYRCTTELICGLAQRKATSAFGHLTRPKICHHFTVISQQQLHSGYQKNSTCLFYPHVAFKRNVSKPISFRICAEIIAL